ncbi:MAG: thiol:disulfide interchange protein [Ignavibacteria bacterium GWB2_35_6b]|nr:MAG: thiol:disulfide interchange protein [Ignavibacteria bacterium GWB2_35_6b]
MKKLQFFFLFSFIFFLSQNIYPQFGFDKQLVTIESFKSFDKIQKGGEIKIAVKAKIEETWHINSHKPNEEFLIPTVLEIPNDFGITIIAEKYPDAKNIRFEFSDQPVAVYEGEILLGAVIKIPDNVELGNYDLVVRLSYQACNNQSCLAPAEVHDTVSIEVVDNQTAINEINSEIFSKLDLSYSQSEIAAENNDEDSLASTLESSGLFLSLLIVFLGGLALNLTPCVYPLIPITVGYFGGQSEGSTGRLFFLGLLYVLGMAVTYSIVGVLTSLSGAIFGTLLQNPIVIIAVAGILVALSLSMFGVYEFKLPDSWVMKAGGAKSGAIGALVMGLTMGIVAAPCIGPFVLGLVTYVGAKGDPVYGFLMFFFLAVGLGFPYLFLALFSGKIKSLPRAGFWMEAVKHIFGFLLIGMALYFIGPLLPKEIDFYVLPVFMIGASLYLLFFDKLADNIIGFRIFKTIFSVAIITLGVYLLWPAEKKSPDWQKFDNASYETSLQNNEKMILDFYADWCIPCKELDALTFSDERVISKSKEFTNYKIDMTKTMSDETEAFRNKFKIVGMPTLIFIDSNGNEVERISQFITAEEILEIMAKIK